MTPTAAPEADPPVNQHTFRVLNPDAAAPASNPEPAPEACGAASGKGEAAAPPVPPRRPLHVRCYQALFQTALAAFYFTVAPLNELLARRRKQPAGRPPRILRMTTMIAQGGVAKVCLQSVLAQPRGEFETSLLIFGGKQAMPPSLQARPDIARLRYKLVIWPNSHRPRLFRDIFKLARLFHRADPDLIHVHEPQFAPAVRIAAALSGGRAITVHLHNDYTVRHQKEHALGRAIQKHALRRAHLIACSRTILEAGQRYLGATHYPLTLIEDGADDRPDCPPDARLAGDLTHAAAGRRILAKMAHLMPHKRIDDFLAAGRILLDEGYPVFILLMAYGKDRFGERMRKHFSSLFAPHEGEFLFRVHAPQHLLDQVAIGVTTSALEGLGLNVLEYQVQGIPVVASDLMPHREMITDGEDGLLFPVGDVPALVRALKRFLDDDALGRQLGEAGRRRAAARTWAATGRRTADYYRSILGGEARSAECGARKNT